MKKVLALCISLLLTASLFTGCSGSGTDVTPTSSPEPSSESTQPSSDEHVTLTFFTGKSETIDVMNEIINSFNESQDRITVIQEYQKEASNVISVRFASDSAPDIMTVYEQGYVDAGKYMDLTDQSQWWSTLSETIREQCTDVTSGKQYRVCTNSTVAGIWYNKDIFAELGLEPATTWDAFVSNLETIKAQMPDVDPLFIYGYDAWSLGHLIEFLPHGYIKQTLGTVDAKKAFLAGDESLLNFGATDGCMAVFAQDLLDLQTNGLINSDCLTATGDDCVQAFAAGETAMFSNGMWVLSSLLQANPDMEDSIGFAPYPAYMPDSQATVLSAEDSGYCISATTEHPEECIEFLNYLFTAENQTLYSEAASAPSAFKGVDAQWAPAGIASEISAVLNDSSVAQIGFTNEKPAGFTGDDAGRMVQELLSGLYTASSFAEAYAQAWDAGITG